MPGSKQTLLQKKLQDIKRAAEERDAGRRAEKFGYPYIDLRSIPVSLEALKLVSEKEAKEAEMVPVATKNREIVAAVFNPETESFQKIKNFLEVKGDKVKIFISSLSGLGEFWRSYKILPPPQKEITGEVELGGSLEEFINRLTNFQAVKDEIKNLDFPGTSTSKLLGMILAGALANKASDIHFEVTEKIAKIRFRLDGVLHEVFGELPLKNYEGIDSRLKLLSGLKINVHDEPQDGRFTIKLGNREIEVRASIIPSEYGETIVLRLLDPSAINLDFEKLGLRKDDLALVKKELAKPNGLILNTGPTGSGKTTTLYSFLTKIANPEIKIITIEDPIEYRLASIEQTQVDPEAGYTFANGLRSIMRQDPDVILVGEIRDLETADIALQAALTGHLVFSTLHTNDAIGAVPRLLDLGVKPLHIGPALNLIIAQRLVRRLCPNCRRKIQPSPEMAGKIKNFLENLPDSVNKNNYCGGEIYEAVGCETCGGIGYKGRIGVFEFLKTGTEFEETILKEASETSLQKLAAEQKMITMQQDGILKVLSGETDFLEVERVTGEIEWG